MCVSPVISLSENAANQKILCRKRLKLLILLRNIRINNEFFLFILL